MFLKEYEGGALLNKYQIRTPAGILVHRESLDSKAVGDFIQGSGVVASFVLKAQLLRGSRGKSGGIVFAGRDDIREKALELFEKDFSGENVKEILIQEKIQITDEFYLSVAMDRALKSPMLVFSTEGGIEIETVASNTPSKVFKSGISDSGVFDKDGLSSFIQKLLGETEYVNDLITRLCCIVDKLFLLFKEEDALLAEINPLVISEMGELIAVDMKTIIDDNALFRHPIFLDNRIRDYTGLEKSAVAAGFSYVELDGDIAVIGNGAGLVMSTIDAVYNLGGSPANFCDIGGGASMEIMEEAVKTALNKDSVKVLLVNIFGGITHCDVIAKALVSSLKSISTVPPVVVRMVGTNDQSAVEILSSENINAFTSFKEAVIEAVNYVNSSK